jgi:hypothetical protein
MPVGRPEWEELPPRLARGGEPVGEPERSRPERSAWERGDVQLNAGGAGKGDGLPDLDTRIL